MSTRANPMAGRYFNDPGIAAAVSNLAGAFAPPSAQEYLLAEQVKGERMNNTAMSDIFRMAGDDFDKLNIGVGNYAPTQSYYAVNTGDATARRGQDVTAATARDVARTNAVAALGSTVLTGDQAMAGLTDEQAAAVGLPEFAPVAGQDIGAPTTPLTETQMKALILQGLTEAEQRATIDVELAQTVDPDTGLPVNRSPLDALGEQPFVNPNSQAAATAITFDRGGVRMGGFITPDGRYTDSNGGPLTPEEAGTAAEVGKPMGTNDELGIGRTTMNENDRRFISSAKGIETVDDAIANFTANPGTQGALGFTRRMFQGAVQTLREAGAVAQDTELSSVANLLEQGLIDEAVAARIDPNYNPALTEAQILGNMVVWAYASAQQGDGRVSNQQLDEAMSALGLNGVFATTADAITAATRVKQMLQRDFNSTASLASPDLVRAYSPEVRNGTGAPPPAAPTPGTPATATPAPAPSTRMRFDANGDPIP